MVPSGTYPQIPPPPLDAEMPADRLAFVRSMRLSPSETDTYLRVALFDENTTGDDDLDSVCLLLPDTA